MPRLLHRNKTVAADGNLPDWHVPINQHTTFFKGKNMTRSALIAALMALALAACNKPAETPAAPAAASAPAATEAAPAATPAK